MWGSNSEEACKGSSTIPAQSGVVLLSSLKKTLAEDSMLPCFTDSHWFLIFTPEEMTAHNSYQVAKWASALALVKGYVESKNLIIIITATISFMLHSLHPRQCAKGLGVLPHLIVQSWNFFLPCLTCKETTTQSYEKQNKTIFIPILQMKKKEKRNLKRSSGFPKVTQPLRDSQNFSCGPWSECRSDVKYTKWYSDIGGWKWWLK